MCINGNIMSTVNACHYLGVLISSNVSPSTHTAADMQCKCYTTVRCSASGDVRCSPERSRCMSGQYLNIIQCRVVPSAKTRHRKARKSSETLHKKTRRACEFFIQ